MDIHIPDTITPSDIDKFVMGLRELCNKCNVKAISKLQIFFKDGSCGGYYGLMKATKLFGDIN